MKNSQYIKAVEQLNQEYINYTHSQVYLKNNRKRKLKRYLRNFAFKRLYFAFKASLYNKFNKKINKNSYILNNNINIKKGKKVVYTCIMNKYDTLRSPVLRTSDTDYIVFSDDQNVVKETNFWKYIEISEEIKKKCNYNPALINRYIKMHPRELFPNYDLALYVDGNVRVISDVEDCFGYINDKTGLAMHEHAKRKDVYEEAKACIKLSKGNKKNIKKLIQKYEKERFPHNFGLYQASVIAVDLKNKNAQKIMSDWYQGFIQEKTGRDQLILPYILWKNNFAFQDVGFLGSNLYNNPKFRVYDHNFKHNHFFMNLVNIKRKIWNFGLQYKCNICHSHLKKWRAGGRNHQIFIDNKIVGAGYRKNFQCPVCGAKDKDRLVYYYLENYTDVFQRANKILHFAPEKIIYQKFKRKCHNYKAIQYYTGDLNSDRADMIVDITDINFPKNTFDYIICNHVLEHVMEEKKAFAELKRVIKPTGKIILTVPVCVSNAKTIEDNSITDPRERMNLFCQEDHVRLYGRDTKKRIEKYGLIVEEFKVKNKDIEEKYGLLEDGIIYIISKGKEDKNEKAV